MTLAPVTLDDKYTLESGRVFLTGVQALVRLPMMQRRRDEAAGLNTVLVAARDLVEVPGQNPAESFAFTDEGLRVDELARVLRVRQAKLVYVTPSAQSPTGAAVPQRPVVRRGRGLAGGRRLQRSDAAGCASAGGASCCSRRRGC